MANIRGARYSQIYGNAREIREHGREINKLMRNMYVEVRSLKRSWYGERYNKLVTLFNDLSKDINKILVLVVGRLPSTLETIANNYARVDTGSYIGRVNNVSPVKVSEITKSKQKGMRFVTSEVNSSKSKIEKMLDEMVSQMNQIETKFKSINWQSGASQSIKTSFEKTKNNIVNSINQIKTTFNKLVTEATAEIEAAENANKTKKTGGANAIVKTNTTSNINAGNATAIASAFAGTVAGNSAAKNNSTQKTAAAPKGNSSTTSSTTYTGSSGKNNNNYISGAVSSGTSSKSSASGGTSSTTSSGTTPFNSEINKLQQEYLEQEAIMKDSNKTKEAKTIASNKMKEIENKINNYNSMQPSGKSSSATSSGSTPFNGEIDKLQQDYLKQEKILNDSNKTGEAKTAASNTMKEIENKINNYNSMQPSGNSSSTTSSGSTPFNSEISKLQQEYLKQEAIMNNSNKTSAAKTLASKKMQEIQDKINNYNGMQSSKK